jgi:hypothetical protein
MDVAQCQTIVEAKGLWRPQDRRKMRMIVEQHPGIRIIMVFGNPNQTISKRSTTTYAEYSRRLGIEVLNEREFSLVLYLAHEAEFALARENVVHQPSHHTRAGLLRASNLAINTQRNRQEQGKAPAGPTDQYSPSDRLFQHLRCLEAHGLSGLDLHRLPSGGIESHAGLRLGHPKSAEAGQSKAALLLHLFDDGFDQVRGRTICRNAAEFCRVLYNLRNELFRHARYS